MKYGVPYQGSKNKIAGWVIDNLPEDEILVDLFAGGCAVQRLQILRIATRMCAVRGQRRSVWHLQQERSLRSERRFLLLWKKK